jgi:Ca2+-dependent lipid-binding protein
VQYKGHIKVVLVEAKGLLKTDSFGTTDAYCKLQLNDVWYRSATIPNTLDPVWNTSYEFPLEANVGEQVLLVKVKDWDSTGRNDLQGTADIYVTRMEPDKEIEVTAYLQNNVREQKGTIHLLVTYIPDRNLGC